MTEELYSPYKLAIELGFTEAKAERYEKLGVTATNMRHIAKAKNMPSTKQTITLEPKKHKHYYRNDGTCACGAVRTKPKAKRSTK